ncbi:hypothetical protein, partial [Neisseria sicca]|uniref:hypothetical protein n=1 Tax=Neisseria sicca TaxID=490 RepID=UPI001C99AE95
TEITLQDIIPTLPQNTQPIPYLITIIILHKKFYPLHAKIISQIQPSQSQSTFSQNQIPNHHPNPHFLSPKFF